MSIEWKDNKKEEYIEYALVVIHINLINDVLWEVYFEDIPRELYLKLMSRFKTNYVILYL